MSKLESRPVCRRRRVGVAASRFLYFQAPIQDFATIYPSGLTEMRPDEELFDFEVPPE